LIDDGEREGPSGVFTVFDRGQINEWAFGYYAPLRRVKQYIDHNYSERISLAKAAQVAGMERKYFSTFFHNKVGICFKDWLMSIRITRAIHLMENENCSVTQLAFMTGFDDLRTFERAFKRYTGAPPLEFKRRLKRLLSTVL
jgi:AraC-like DNA-binding protein